MGTSKLKRSSPDKSSFFAYEKELSKQLDIIAKNINHFGEERKQYSSLPQESDKDSQQAFALQNRGEEIVLNFGNGVKIKVTKTDVETNSPLVEDPRTTDKEPLEDEQKVHGKNTTKDVIPNGRIHNQYTAHNSHFLENPVPEVRLICVENGKDDEMTVREETKMRKLSYSSKGKETRSRIQEDKEAGLSDRNLRQLKPQTIWENVHQEKQVRVEESETPVRRLSHDSTSGTNTYQNENEDGYFVNSHQEQFKTTNIRGETSHADQEGKELKEDMRRVSVTDRVGENTSAAQKTAQCGDTKHQGKVLSKSNRNDNIYEHHWKNWSTNKNSRDCLQNDAIHERQITYIDQNRTGNLKFQLTDSGTNDDETHQAQDTAYQQQAFGVKRSGHTRARGPRMEPVGAMGYENIPDRDEVFFNEKGITRYNTSSSHIQDNIEKFENKLLRQDKLLGDKLDAIVNDIEHPVNSKDQRSQKKYQQKQEANEDDEMFDYGSEDFSEDEGSYSYCSVCSDSQCEDCMFFNTDEEYSDYLENGTCSDEQIDRSDYKGEGKESHERQLEKINQNEYLTHRNPKYLNSKRSPTCERRRHTPVKSFNGEGKFIQTSNMGAQSNEQNTEFQRMCLKTGETGDYVQSYVYQPNVNPRKSNLINKGTNDTYPKREKIKARVLGQRNETIINDLLTVYSAVDKLHAEVLAKPAPCLIKRRQSYPFTEHETGCCQSRHQCSQNIRQQNQKETKTCNSAYDGTTNGSGHKPKPRNSLETILMLSSDSEEDSAEQENEECSNMRKKVAFDVETKLEDAILHNNWRDAKYLIDKKNADACQITSDGKTLLHLAAQKGHFECVRGLVKRGLDVNSRDSHYWFPVHYALQERHYKCVALLLVSGCDFNEYLEQLFQYRQTSGTNPLESEKTTADREVILRSIHYV